ncbi:MAG TPA: hypothetical protein VFW90_00100, partial [Candidatus Saccharimonadales bacterium]|nr:hypothetical protein [Candidatus Saccharimonadales bacterium]
DTIFTFTTGSEDKIALAESSVAGAEQVNAELERVGRVAMANQIIWPGHYHSALENLANAQTVFRGLLQ